MVPLGQCLSCFSKKNSFLDKMITGGEKGFYYKNPKWRILWLDPGQPSTSQPK